MNRSARALFALVALLGCSVARAESVSICADPDPPPWTYWVRDAQNRKTPVFAGSSVDIFTTAFKRMGLDVRYIGDAPWARCLKMVQDGDVDFAMDAYYDTDRAKVFAFSHHYNTLTPQVFYRTRHPIVATTKADLKHYQGCGMIGASYEHYGLGPDELDRGVNTYEAMIAKLKAGRCDYFVEELEVITGYKAVGRDLLGDPDIRSNAISDAPAPAKHLITKKDGKGEKLLARLNEILDSMNKKGELAAIWKKHAPNLPFKP